VIGAGIGAGGSALLGGDPGKGALLGAIGGGFIGGGELLGASLGLGTAGTVGLDALAGAAGGAVGGAVTGGNVGKDALFGGLAGGIAGLTAPTTPLGQSATGTVSPAGGAPSAGGAAGASATPAAGTAIAASGLPDLTAPGIETISVTAPSLPAASLVPTTGAMAGGALAGASLIGSGSGAITSTDLPAGGPGSPLSQPSVGARGIGTNQPGALGAGTATSSVGKFAENPSLHGFGDIISSNPAAVVGALGLGYEALSQPKVPGVSETTNALKGQADQFAAQGAALEGYLNTGKLPPGVQSSVDNATAAAKATLRSRFAAMGLTGSTGEASALAQVDQNAATQVFDIANNLLQTGIKESGLSADIYKSLLGQANAQDQNMSNAIAAFAASMAGGGNKGVNINLGGGA
jgi:hypothetical protein